MKPAPLALLSTLSIGLLGYAFYVLTIPSEPRPRNLGSEEAVAPPAPRYEAEEAPVVRMARALQARPEEEASSDGGEVVAPAPAPSGESAAAAFERVLDELAAIPGPEALGAVRRERLYRELSGTFAALSNELGASDADALEQAYQRMRQEASRLELGVAPKKRPSQE